MFHPIIIAAYQERLERQYAEALPGGRLERLPVETCLSWRRDLDRLWDPEARTPLRPLTQEEQVFVVNEQLLTAIDYPYWAQRYCVIQSEGQRLKPMYPLWESQELILAEVARMELVRQREGHPDGLLFNLLKGRQLGASTWTQSVLAHRTTTHAYVKSLIASDVPDNSGSQGLFGMLELVVANLPWWLKPGELFHNKDKHIVFRNGSSVIVESGKSMKGGLQEEGGQKGNIGRSKTYSTVHLSELSTWERPEQIDDGLMPAVPITPRTFMGRESTAKGRHNWWHMEWLLAEQGLGRCFNIFIPWYAERSKYWLPTPGAWIPSDDTLQFARRVQEKGPRYMRRAIALDPEQLYWYERKKLEAVEKGELFKFLEEYPAEPEEAFQYSGRSIFPIVVMDRLENQQRPLVDLLTVKPHLELIADQEAMITELQDEQRQMRATAAKAQTRAQDRVVETLTPQMVRQETPTLLEGEPAEDPQKEPA
jgi:hypothetical protein